jgi:hypothetical protein
MAQTGEGLARRRGGGHWDLTGPAAPGGEFRGHLGKEAAWGRLPGMCCWLSLTWLKV